MDILLDTPTTELLALNAQLRAEIAARERIEKELRESRAELRFVTENAAVLLAHCDRDSRYVFVNRPYAQRMGVAPQDVVGKRIEDVIGREAWAAIEPYVQRTLAGERVEFEVEIPYDKIPSRFMHCVYVPDTDNETGCVKGWVAAISDITDRRRLEEQLRDADRRKDEFLAVLAHELRNPLAPMQNAVRILELKAPGDAAVQGATQIMRRQVGHMARLVDDLLEISRITGDRIRLECEPVDLSAVVTNAAEAVRPAIEAAGQLLIVSSSAGPPYVSSEGSPDASNASSLYVSSASSPYVEGDTVRLTQVITNLLNNANRYTPRAGRISIQLTQSAGEARIRIADTGIGIAPTMRDRVFEMFVQLDAAHAHSRGGLGIGLTLAKRLVDLHNGRIEVDSEGEGRGSAFTVCLPLMARPPQRRDVVKASGSITNAARILVADDNTDAAESLALALESAGHTVRVSYDGASAVQSMESFTPEIAILDIGMPRLDGYEAARRIRRLPHGLDCVLVALSGWGQSEDKRRAREAGFDEHLTKPVDPEALLQVIARLRSHGSPRIS